MSVPHRKNYTDKANWHEAANLFPLVSEEELAELAGDIRENGLQNPIVLLGDKVLDGRNRVLACRVAGVEPDFIEWKSKNGVTPLSWAISQNLKRRNLTAGQKAAIAFESIGLFDEEAAKRRKETEGRPTKEKLSQKVDADKSRNDGRSTTQAAKAFDTNRQYVADIKKIHIKAPEMVEKIKQGDITIADAQKELGFKQSTTAMVSAESNEWYTPENYVEAAREVLGKFDLDPASCAFANKVVKAKKFFTEEDDGLSKKWSGKVWMNPPYGDVGPKFVARLIEDYEAGNIEEAIVLLNYHCTDAKWFKPLFNYVICFTDHRSKFYTKDGPGGSPTHGSVFVYFGENPDYFADVFKKFGAVIERRKRESVAESKAA